MPETDGVKLSRQIDARHILFISGYDQKALVETNASFMQKPFNRDEVSRAVRGLLDGDRAACRGPARASL
jgi:DNA-binding response OmpR family regulator